MSFAWLIYDYTHKPYLCKILNCNCLLKIILYYLISYLYCMKTRDYPQVIKEKLPNREGIKKTVKIFTVSVLALLALGFCTTSQRLNAG